jgi:hypothetical protein
MTHTLFNAKAPKIVGDLMHDLGLTLNQACGILGNIGRECAGFTLLQEQSPTAGVGGYGWCQWTGPRRRAFFAFCASKHLSVNSDAGNYAYLLHELQTTEAGAITALKRATDLTSCVAAFERAFERAGVPAIADRVTWAKIALDAFTKQHITA